MITKWAKIFGGIFLILGILGFIPGITVNGYLLGLFHVNLWHNLVHILTGLVFLWAGSTSAITSKKVFQVFTVIYGLVALLGFIYGERYIFGFLANNWADTLFHVVVTAAAAYFGFATKPYAQVEPRTQHR